MYIITIDSGTTNTRVRVWLNQKVIAETSQPVGVRDTAITGSKNKLLQAVKHAFDEALSVANIVDEANLLILASGMITSNMGLCEIPHLSAPISLPELAKGLVKKQLPEITSTPIWFIPGIKNSVGDGIDINTCEVMDMMRGEEVETVGILSLIATQNSALIVLPGSHSKFVKVDDQQNITACTTTIAGELLDVITGQTIIANSLNHQFASELDGDYLLKGAKYCQQVGLARSCFLIRIQDLFTQTSINQRANFLLGAVLYSDLLTIKYSQALAVEPSTSIIISGKTLLREALYLLMTRDDFFTGKIITIEEEKQKPLSGLGAIRLAQMANLLHEESN